ncbi:MAG: hypothetical protein HY954_02660 [Deltaproteobacteria bacterium]|nr:hypothetical protein [Deltaproteobacteria bacterium]
MLEKKGPNLLHWNYFLALESDLKHLSRYIEFSEENHKTYSLELAHLLLAAASEVDVVLKGLCKKIQPESEPRNINEYREIVVPRFPKLCEMKMRIPRYGLEIVPWENWKDGCSPNWWCAYNDVKHKRDRFFSQATLQHTIAAVAGLFVVLLYYTKKKQNLVSFYQRLRF